MLRYSYKVEAKRVECQLNSLILDNERNPSQRAREAIEQKRKELRWYQERIEAGKDPGAIIL
jgi:hypothetical protein